MNTPIKQLDAGGSGMLAVTTNNMLYLRSNSYKNATSTSYTTVIIFRFCFYFFYSISPESVFYFYNPCYKSTLQKWKNVGRGIAYAASGEDVIFARDSSYKVWYRDGIRRSKEIGDNWVEINGARLAQFDTFGDVIWGINPYGDLYTAAILRSYGN